MSKAELVALSELHRGWVEEQGNDHPFYYVLYLALINIIGTAKYRGNIFDMG